MQAYRLKGASGKVANQLFPLGERTVMGCAADCDLVIEDSGVAPRHAQISLLENGELELEQLDGAYETYVNGTVVKRAGLASGDEIRIGNCRWVLQAPGLKPGKVLTADAVRQKHAALPWLIVIALLAASMLAWQRGWLPF